MTTIEIEKLLRDTVLNEMTEEARHLMAHNILAAILKTKWDGKKINARIVEQFKESFKRTNDVEVYARLDRHCGMTNLEVWGFGQHTTSSNRLILFIGYDSEPTEPRLAGACVNAYRAEAFEETDLCHGRAAHERNEKRSKLLSNGCEIIPLIAAAKAVELAAQEQIKTILSTDLGDVIKYTVGRATKDLS